MVVIKEQKTKLKVGDEAIVISGKSKGQKGEILALNKKSGRVILKGVNMKQRFTRPTQENPKGGVVEAEMPMQLSNIQYYDGKSKKGTRIKMGTDKNGKKVRVSVATGKELD